MITHPNAHFVLYADRVDKTLHVHLATTGDLEQLREQMVDLGEPIAAHLVTFDGFNEREQLVAFDRAQRAGSADYAEIMCMERLLLLGVAAGRELGAREARATRSQEVLATMRLPSPEDAATD
ncbi:MAG: hypothetical protein QY323_04995 [Patescibacteria group bacterium]|nr:MAG: hypothetical protein QY323_04995 [Patescibacteria group bacterium]